MSVYNQHEYLSAALDSLAQQAMKDFDVVLIDNGSTDGSGDLGAAFTSIPLHLRRIPHRGVAAALNIGVRQATGEYIARQDADDMSLPERFSKQVEFLDRHPNCSAVGTAANIIDASGRRDGELFYSHPDLSNFTDPISIRNRLPIVNCIVGGTVMMRKNVISALHYREEFRLASDYDLWLRMSESHQLCNLAEPLYRYRIHDGSMWASYRAPGLVYLRIAQLLAAERRITGSDMLERNERSRFHDLFDTPLKLASQGQLYQSHRLLQKARLAVGV